MNSKFYCYILETNDNKKYYGHTNNLTQRLRDHRSGQVSFTKNKRPIKLVYYEEFQTRSQAFNREMQFKDGRTRKKTMQKLVVSFPEEKCQGFNSRL